MNTIYFNRNINDDQRRKELYEGQLFVYTPTPTLIEFIDFAKGLIQEAFGDLDPETAQYHLPVMEYVSILRKLKPTFIHHPKSKAFLQTILIEMGCDPKQTYFDVPRMRSSTSDGYLTSGIAYAFHPHRDTWYSAPMSQINFWLPIYEVESGNVMAFHTNYFNKGLENSSNTYNYQNWAATSRKEAAKHIKKDTREQPKATEPIQADPQLRVITPPGGALLFSANHLHSSVENKTKKTRFSIDFRVVHLGDLQNDIGAPNVDSACTGTTMQDYLRVADLEKIPSAVIERYMKRHPQPVILNGVG